MHTTITVLGAGYVGLTTAALLAHSGYTVYVVEPNRARLNVIKQGRSFFFEEGLDRLIALGIEMGRLIPTDSYEASVPQSSIVFSCVGTPDNDDGSSNLEYVFAAADKTAQLAKANTIYVQKSTVPVGTGELIEKRFNAVSASLSYVSNPEFLRESTAVYDTLFFDRVVAGGRETSAVDAVLHIYMELEKYREHIAHIARIPIGPRGDRYIPTTLNSAELIKVTANAFLAMKISFANSIAQLADKAGADVVEVMEAVGADNRIGPAFLNAGRGYGGGCFPKDVSGLISSARAYGVELAIMRAVQDVNASMPAYVVSLLSDAVGDISGMRIAVLGLAFKAGTSDTRKSPGVAIANMLARAGAVVTAYDPEAGDEAREDMDAAIKIHDAIETAITQVDAVVITTDWQSIINFDARDVARHMRGRTLLDAVNRYDRQSTVDAGIHYIGVGRSV